MKTAFATLVLLLLTASVIAQENTRTLDPPDVTVLEKSWRKEVLHPGRDPNPLAPNENLMRQTRAEKTEIRNRDYDPPQPTERRMPIVSPGPLTERMELLTTYVFKIKVQNNGPKTIKALYWEYQFLDPDTGNVMGYRKIANRVKLSPGKTEVLGQRSTRQPSILVHADSLDKKYKDQFTERLIIHRIQYTDGSVWQRPRTH